MTTSTTTDRVRYGAGGGIYRIVATPAETGNAHFAFQAIEPPGGGPPLHIHTREDEFFLVLEGEISFYIDGRVIRARAGQSAFVPRGAAHCFKNCSDRAARLLVLFTPAALRGSSNTGRPTKTAGRHPMRCCFVDWTNWRRSSGFRCSVRHHFEA